MHAVERTGAPNEAGSMPGAVSRDTLDRLRRYVALLLRWNATINLIGRADAADPDFVWDRHIADCLRLLPLVPGDVTAATDLGSGAGLPGLVLAIAAGVPFALIEADRRKAAFLIEAARVTEAPVTIHCARIEAAPFAPTFIAPAPLVTARALAPLPRLLDYAHPLLAPGGICLFPKGPSAAAEIADAKRQGWRFTVDRHDGGAAPWAPPGATILRLSDLARA
jgi:16S rRNA (guanine527-N7)-methyltransferase